MLVTCSTSDSGPLLLSATLFGKAASICSSRSWSDWVQAISVNFTAVTNQPMPSRQRRAHCSTAEQWLQPLAIASQVGDHHLHSITDASGWHTFSICCRIILQHAYTSPGPDRFQSVACCARQQTTDWLAVHARLRLNPYHLEGTLSKHLFSHPHWHGNSNDHHRFSVHFSMEQLGTSKSRPTDAR